MVENDRRSGGGRREDDVYARWNLRVRDAIIFAIGAVGCIHEIFIVPQPRPSILLFLGSLLGLPFVLSADEKRQIKKNGDD